MTEETFICSGCKETDLSKMSIIFSEGLWLCATCAKLIKNEGGHLFLMLQKEKEKTALLEKTIEGLEDMLHDILGDGFESYIEYYLDKRQEK